MANFVLRTRDKLISAWVTVEGEDFKKLVKGETIKHTQGEFTLEVCLSDIGFGIMRNYIDEAERGS